MGLLGTGTPKRTVVKVYGRGNLLFAAANSVLIALLSAVGVRPPVRSADRLQYELAQDAREMAGRGYRLVSAELDEMAFLGARIPYARATYELADPGR
jgi:hypothetical protein